MRRISEGPTRRSMDRYANQRGVTLKEVFIVVLILAIVVLLAPLVARQCSKSASPLAGTPVATYAIAAAQETIHVAAKNFSIHMAPTVDCSKATSLAADVAAAQTKINEVARDYPSEYAANKPLVERDVDALNDSIRGYNHDCGSTIPLITLPP